MRYINFFFSFIFFANSTLAQTFNIESLKFPSIGSIEYRFSFQGFYRDYSTVRNFKLWYIASTEHNSVIEFVLSDSLETVVYLDGLVTHFIHSTKQKHFYFYNQQEAYQVYWIKLSTPHLLPAFVYDKNIKRGTLSIIKDGSLSKVKIDVKYTNDTTKYKNFIIQSEFRDSVILNYSTKFFKPSGDSNFLSMKYPKMAIPLNKKYVDSIAKYYLCLYDSYEKGMVMKTTLPSRFPLNDSIFNLNDSLVNLFDSSAKLIVIDFWYMACPPCVASIPTLNKLYKKYFLQGIRMIGVNQYDTSRIILNKFIEKKNIQYPIALKKNNTYFDNCDVKAFPTMIIIDKKGNQLYEKVGYAPEDEKMLEGIIEKLLELN